MEWLQDYIRVVAKNEQVPDAADLIVSVALEAASSALYLMFSVASLFSNPKFLEQYLQTNIYG